MRKVGILLFASAVVFAADAAFLYNAGEHSSLGLLVAVMLLLFSINIGAFALVGEYLGRIFIETRGRPPFIVREILRHEAKATDPKDGRA